MDVREKVQKILSEIEHIPPQNKTLKRIVKALENQNVEVSVIAELVEQSPALTAEIIKIANSVFYSRMYTKYVTDVKDAIKRIGLNTLRYFILYSGLTAALSEKYKNIDKTIVNHSKKVAEYAKQISYIFNLKEYADVIYICGLLHDIGKLVLLYFQNDAYLLIEKGAQKSSLTKIEIEKKVIGITHAETAYKILKKWNFPDIILEPILYHHSPEDADNMDIAYTIYLADFLANSESSPNLPESETIKFKSVIPSYLSLKENDTKESVHLKEQLINNDISGFLHSLSEKI